MVNNNIKTSLIFPPEPDLNEILDKFSNDLSGNSPIETSNPFDFLKDKTLLITGATSYFLRYLPFVIQKINQKFETNTKTVLLNRSKEKSQEIFGELLDDPHFIFINQDITEQIDYAESVDYIIHGASFANTDLRDLKPIETSKTNYLGTANLLDFAIAHQPENLKSGKFIYLSSVDLYGDLNPLNNKNAYTLSKLAAENLVYSYHFEKNLTTYILRPSQILAPTVDLQDSRILGSFLNQAINEKKISLRHDGSEIRNFIDVVDVILVLLKLLAIQDGDYEELSTEIINLTTPDPTSVLEFAQYLAKISDAELSVGTSKSKVAPKISPEPELLNNLRWKVNYNYQQSLDRIYNYLIS